MYGKKYGNSKAQGNKRGDGGGALPKVTGSAKRQLDRAAKPRKG